MLIDFKLFYRHFSLIIHFYHSFAFEISSYDKESSGDSSDSRFIVSSIPKSNPSFHEPKSRFIASSIPKSQVSFNEPNSRFVFSSFPNDGRSKVKKPRGRIPSSFEADTHSQNVKSSDGFFSYDDLNKLSQTEKPPPEMISEEEEFRVRKMLSSFNQKCEDEAYAYKRAWWKYVTDKNDKNLELMVCLFFY